jgi:hypothetical protein
MIGSNDIEHGVGVVTNNSWSETGLTWNNQPIAGRRFATWIPTAGSPVEFVVTSQVLDALARDKKFSVQLHSIHNSGGAGNIEYASREQVDVNSRPQLLLLMAGLPRPRIEALELSGTNLIFSGASGIPGGNYYVLVSTNIAVPISEWARVATNVFDTSGGFSFSQPLSVNQPQMFYSLQLP